MKYIPRMLICLSSLVILFSSEAGGYTNRDSNGQLLPNKISIKNGHFPGGKLSYGEPKRLIIEGMPNTCRIKITEGYHILYGGLFVNGQKVRNYGAETILKTVVGNEEKQLFADNRIEDYYVIDTRPFNGELKLVLIKPVLDKDGYLQWTNDGSIVSEKISPNDVIIDVIEDTPVVKSMARTLSKTSTDRPHWKEIIGPSTVQQFDVQYTDCPIHIKTRDGHVFCIARYKDSQSFKGFILAVSDDWGETFTYKQLLLSEYHFGEGDYPTLVFDEKKKTLFLFSNNKYVTSRDYGNSFSEVKTVNVNTNEIEVDSECREKKVITGAGNGIVLSNGIICIPMNVVQFYAADGKGHTKRECKKAQCFVLYSKNHGKTWQQTPFTSADVFAWEFSMAEYESNKLMINARSGNEETQKRTSHGRRVFISEIAKNAIRGWEVEKWTLDSSDGSIWDPICNASFVKAKIGGKTMGLYSSPYIPGHYAPRINITLQVAEDFRHWKPTIQLTEPYKVMQGYTSLDATGGRVTVAACEQYGQGIVFTEIDNIEKFL